MTTAEREKIEDRSRVMEREKKEQIVERRKLEWSYHHQWQTGLTNWMLDGVFIVLVETYHLQAL